MGKPKVAIIIPNYNKAKYLPECIDSVLNQTYDNIEIIIVDDHSTDQSNTIIERYSKNHQNIHHYKFPKNHGVSYTRNYGAKQTEADYLVFLDSDDVYINKDKIKNEVSIINQNKVSFSQWVPMDIKGNILPYNIYKINPLRHRIAISKILSIALPPYKQLRGYMIPSSIFKKIGGYNTQLSYYEDFDLQCRLGLEAKFVYTKKIGEAYRQGTGGLSSQNIEDVNITINDIRKKYINKLNFIQKIAFNYYMRKK